MTAIMMIAMALPAGLAAADLSAGERTLLPENAVACGAPTRDVTGYDLVGVSLDGSPHPGIPADVKALTLPLSVWKCMHPEENAPSSELPPVPRVPGMVVPPPPDGGTLHPQGVTPMWGPSGSPYAGLTGGVATYTILLPNLGDSLYPVGQCNWDATVTGLNYLKNNVVQGWYDLYCYYLPQWNTGGNTNVGTLLTQLDVATNTNYPWLVNDPSELIIGIVKQASNMGAAGQPAQSSIVAEVRTDGWDSPHPSVVMHEVGHNWGASHYPADDFRVYICQITESDMNYCDMQSGSDVFDPANKDRVHERYWRVS